MKTLLLLCLLGAAVAWKTYDGYQVLEVTPETTSQVDFLKNLMHTREELDFWLEPSTVERRVHVMASPDLVDELRAMLQLKDLKITVVHENLRDVVGDEPKAKKDTPEQRVYNYDIYNEFEEFIGELDNLVLECDGNSDITCETEVIGRSHEERELKILKINTGAENNFWVDSCIHAREWLACATVMNIVQKMITENSAESNRVLMSHNWYILPVFNPDGYTYTFTDDRFWRKSRSPNSGSACIGTDLNRNHDYMWNTGGSSSSPCSDTYHGIAASSEVEVNIVEGYTVGLSNLRGWLSFHTYGQYWLVPYGDGTIDPTFGQDALAVGDVTCTAIMRTYNTIWRCGNSEDVLYGTSGTTADFAMGAARAKYSYTPELRGNSFAPPTDDIAPSVQEIWNGLVAKIDDIARIEGA